MDQLTDAKRSELREQGIFPYSRDFTVFCIFLGAFLGSRIIPSVLIAEFELRTVLISSLAIPLGAALGAVISTLLQSRFLLRFSRGRPSPHLPEMSAIAFHAVKAVVLVGAVVLVFKQLEESLLQDNPGNLRSLLSFSLGVASGVFFVFGLVGFLLSRFQFTHRHSMSREQILAEAREGEMRPEIRAATERMFAGSE